MSHKKFKTYKLELGHPVDGKKTSHFEFTLPGVRGIHTNPKQNNFSNPVRAFLENPLFVLWLTLIMDLADPGTFSENF
jgi:hypothetical protein